MIRLLAVLLAGFVFFAGDASAHTRSTSQSRWNVDGDVLDVHVDAEALDVTRLYALGHQDQPMESVFADEVAHGLRARADGRACAPAGAPRAAIAAPGRISASWRFTCPAGALARGPIEIESSLFIRVAPSHLHFVALRDTQGRIAEAVLTEPHPRASLELANAPQAQSFWQTVARFLPVGAEHVWTGLDHVAFILALVLLVGGDIRRVVLAATGFTFGHTATLGLAAAGVLKPHQASIEALIGFTIAFVALEVGGAHGSDRMKAWPAPIAGLLALGGLGALAQLAPMSPLVWFGLAAFVYAYPRGFPRGAVWLAAIFGLIHGCGFAGALSALDLPRPRLLASLLGFNLGVEFGQITIIAGALLIALAARRAPAALRQDALAGAGASLFALGFYWFVSRLIAS